VAELATRQYGVVAHWQLVALGFSASAIYRMVRTGRLHPRYKGVYAVGHAVLTRQGHWMAAVLACGEEATLSHRDATMFHGLRQFARPAIDVSAARSRHHQYGITVHRPRRIHPDDRIVVERIPVTTVERTLLDLAEVVSPRVLKYVFDEAERLGRIDMRAMDALLDRSRGRRGLKALAKLLAKARAHVPYTRSDFERDFLELCRELGLPEPAVNIWVAGHEVDILWEHLKLIVELDSRTYHQARAAMEADAIRNADLALAGYRVVPITDRRFYAERDEVRRSLAHLIPISEKPIAA
jgi:hypothetical protein